jgi:Protein of unknown function (DUF3433)
MARSRRSVRKEWKTWRLSKWFTGSLLFLEIAIIIIIIALERWSAKNQGIATVPSVTTSNTSGSQPSVVNGWSYGLLWTTFPAFLMALYRLGWDAIVAGTAEREPFIALNRPEDKASAALKTVMLDYRTYPMLYNWLIAFRRKHGLIGCGMLLSSVLSIALVPLTSHLLVVAPAARLSTFSTVVPKGFDMQRPGDINLQPAFSIARATLGYGASPPAWTTSRYAFEPFHLKELAGSHNYTALTDGYYGQLDCNIINAPPQASPNTFMTNMTKVNFNVKDRDCSTPYLNMYVANNDTAKLLTVSTTNINCGDTAHFSRIVIGMGNPISVDIIANLTVLSCIPSYWKVSGMLTVETSNSNPKVVNFDADDKTANEIRPKVWRLFENNLSKYKQVDPRNSVSSSDTFSILVYEIATRLNPQNPLDPPNVQKALEQAWSGVFAYVAATAVIEAPSTRVVDAQISSIKQRLFVVTPVAWTIVVIMLLVLICNALLIWHAEVNTSILEEEPIGLLGSAILLHDSDLSKFLADRRCQISNEEEVDEGIEKDLRNYSFWFDHDTRRIKLKRDEESLDGTPEVQKIEPKTASGASSTQRAASIERRSTAPR